MLNKFIAIGNTTKDTEIRTMPSGKSVSNFGFAVNESYKNQAGEKCDKTVFLTCSMFGKMAEMSIPKGTRLAIEGKLVQDNWEKDGKKFSAIKVEVSGITFLTPKKQESQPADTQNTEGPVDDDLVIPGEEEMF